MRSCWIKETKTGVVGGWRGCGGGGSIKETPYKESVSQTSYDIAYMWNIKKNDTKELIYRTETDSQT